MALEDRKTLAEYNISDQSTLQLVLSKTSQSDDYSGYQFSHQSNPYGVDDGDQQAYYNSSSG